MKTLFYCTGKPQSALMFPSFVISMVNMDKCRPLTKTQLNPRTIKFDSDCINAVIDCLYTIFDCLHPCENSRSLCLFIGLIVIILFLICKGECHFYQLYLDN